MSAAPSSKTVTAWPFVNSIGRALALGGLRAPEERPLGGSPLRASAGYTNQACGRIIGISAESFSRSARRVSGEDGRSLQHLAARTHRLNLEVRAGSRGGDGRFKS